MKETINNKTKIVKNLDELAEAMIGLFIEMYNRGTTEIGYVSGIITSEGLENMPKNIARLERFTDLIKRQSKISVFSPTDIFSDDLFARIDATGAKNTDYELFWRRTLSSGYVTHMFMTPRWEISHGSRDEHEIAKKQNMKIVYITDEV